MPLDRTWYDTLVDDDGSGMTGSVWDKADVDALMDAIDAQLPTTNIFYPSVATLSGGAPSYAYRNGLWAKSGTLVYVSGRITLASKGSLPAAQPLVIGDLPHASSSWVPQGGFSIGSYGGLAIPIVGLNMFIPVSAQYAQITYGPPAGAGGAPILTVDHVADGFDLIFGGCYKTD